MQSVAEVKAFCKPPGKGLPGATIATEPTLLGDSSPYRRRVLARFAHFSFQSFRRLRTVYENNITARRLIILR